jgi:hypothetical protein
MKLLVHIEQYDMVGILPSQLESIALLDAAMGITEAAYIDGTPDGFSGIGQFTRYASLADFFAAESGPFVAFSPDGEDIRTATVADPDSWLIFGPSMGWADLLNGVDVQMVSLPGGVMCSRDVVPIAIWELSGWRAQ